MDEKIKLELAFKNQEFSGIVVGEFFVEEGEVVDYIKWLEERQKWIDEVARPTHPDDERPWCAAYLDCREKIKELEENNEGLRDALNLRKGALVQATNGIKQLNERIEELEDGIEKHRKQFNDPLLDYPEWIDNELYELIW